MHIIQKVLCRCPGRNPNIYVFCVPNSFTHTFAHCSPRGQTYGQNYCTVARSGHCANYSFLKRGTPCAGACTPRCDEQPEQSFSSGPWVHSRLFAHSIPIWNITIPTAPQLTEIQTTCVLSMDDDMVARPQDLVLASNQRHI